MEIIKAATGVTVPVYTDEEWAIIVSKNLGKTD
jgi:hypothetical protein